MKTSVLIAALLLSVGLTACDKPTVVNVPPPATPVPGPAGPTGATGNTGATGMTGQQGASGPQGGAAVIIVAPPASAVQN
jgi:hypothetical protein